MHSPKTLLEAIKYFSDEQVCIDTVAAMRWPDGVTCPDCSAPTPYYLKTAKRWKCRACKRQFSVKQGSIFEDSPISLSKWLPTLWLICNCKNGISSYEVARDLGVTQKTGWFMLQRLRLVLKHLGIDAKLGLNADCGPTEIDETFVGGRVQNMHKHKRIQSVAKGGNKTVVFGMLERGGRVKAMTLPGRKKQHIDPAMTANIQEGAHIITDEFATYDVLETPYHREIINHTTNYVSGQIHTNGIENFWALLKRGLRGTYISVTPKHLDRYIDEQVYRFNNRATKDNPLNDADRFTLALTQVAGRRLTYKQLIAR